MRGIYKITNAVNGKVYIGKSENIHHRWKQHIRELNKNKHSNAYLQNAWNKYSQANFEFSIVYEALDNEDLDELEIKFISEYNSFNDEYGYNLTSGGEGSKRAESTKEKISVGYRRNRSTLTFDDVRHIKMLMYCLMDRKEICNMFNIADGTLTQITSGKNFKYILPELTEQINDIKQKFINDRNQKIIEYYMSGMRICDIHRKTGYSESIIEKAIYSKGLQHKNANARKFPEDIELEICDKYRNGISIIQLSNEYHASQTTIRNILCFYKLK